MSLSIFEGRCRVCQERIVHECAGLRRESPDSDRPVLLRQGLLQEPVGSGRGHRREVRPDSGDLRKPARLSRLQPGRPVHRCGAGQCPAEAVPGSWRLTTGLVL